MDGMRTFLLADDDDRRAIERGCTTACSSSSSPSRSTSRSPAASSKTDPREAAGLLDESADRRRRCARRAPRARQRIHPSLLDTQGLIAALRTAAATAPIPTRVEGAVEDTIPAEVAMTVYRCCVGTLAAARGEIARATIAVRARERRRRIRDLAGRRRGCGRRARPPCRARRGPGRLLRNGSGPRRGAPAPHLMSRPRPGTGRRPSPACGSTSPSRAPA